MLTSMRKATESLIGKAIMALVFGLIIFAFAVWGSREDFRGLGSNKIASVGGYPIAPQEFHDAYQTMMQQYQRQMKIGLTNAQAHAMGLDVQTLGRLIADKALDVQALSLGLAISDQTIAEAVRNDPRLKDPSGAFSRDRFDQVLRDSGLSERGFIAEQRNTDLRQQIGVSLVDGLTAPKALVEALARFDAQTRAVDAIALPPSAAGEIPAPTPEQLQNFYNDRKSSYRAPEYRAVNVVSVTPTTLAKPAEVTDDDARALYEKVKDSRFGAPERRKLQQIVFPNEAEADDALAKIKAGASFDDIAKARNLTDKDIDLGDVTRAGVFDKAIADAGFALPPGGVSEVVKGAFGPAIVRVTQITPASIKPYEEVAAELKKEIAVGRAANDVLAIHDKIEDARVSGKSLTEAAQAVGLDARAIPAVDAQGRDKSGAAGRGLPDKDAVAARGLRLRRRRRRRSRSPPRIAASSGSRSPRSSPRATARSTRSRTRSPSSGATRKPPRRCPPRPPISSSSSTRARRSPDSPRAASARGQDRRPTSIGAAAAARCSGGRRRVQHCADGRGLGGDARRARGVQDHGRRDAADRFRRRQSVKALAIEIADAMRMTSDRPICRRAEARARRRRQRQRLAGGRRQLREP